MGKIIVISGHGHYATGIRSTLELLAGNLSDFHYVDFTEEDTDTTLKSKMLDIIEKNKGSEILFICDLLGGTPFRVAAELSMTSNQIEVVAGCNIGGILDFALTKDQIPFSSLPEKIVEKSMQSVVHFK